MKSLQLLIAATAVAALSGGATAEAGRAGKAQQTQTRSDQWKDTGERAEDSSRSESSTRGRSAQDQRDRDYDRTRQGADTTGRATTSGTLREVDRLGSARVIFYRLGPADMRMSKLIGLEVRNLQNENVGEIEDIILEDGKTMRAVVIGVGGFLGMGERYVAVDPSSIVISRNDDGDTEAVLNTTREDLREAPQFRFDERRRRVGQAY